MGSEALRARHVTSTRRLPLPGGSPAWGSPSGEGGEKVQTYWYTSYEIELQGGVTVTITEPVDLGNGKWYSKASITGAFAYKYCCLPC